MSEDTNHKELIQGAKGCFSADTLVHTPTGEVKISELNIGDNVISFAPDGSLSVEEITKIHIHNDEQLYRFKYWNGEIDATENHWVLKNDNVFEEIGSLTEDDCLVDAKGYLVPYLSKEYLGVFTVYNLTVTGHHTYIAGNLRVHNKGGGKSGGSVRVPVEDPDTLHSTQYAKVLDLVAEGEIVGLANGLESVYLDNTPIQNPNGTLNFTGFNFGFARGTPDQGSIGDFDAVESENIVGTELKGGVTGSTLTVEPNVVINPLTNYIVSGITTDGEIRIYFTSSGAQCTQEQVDKQKGGCEGFGQYLDPIDWRIEIKEGAGSYVQAAIGTINYPRDQQTSEDGGVKNSAVFLLLGKINVNSQSDGSVICTVTKDVSFDVRISRTDDNSALPVEARSELVLSKYSYNPFTGAIPIVRRLTDPNLTSCRVTLSVPRLTKQDKDDGDLHGTKVDYTIFLQNNNGGFYSIYDGSFNGKTTTKYTRSHKFNLPQPGPWDIRIQRDTDSRAGQSEYVDNIYWDTYTEIIDTKLSYPNSAYAFIEVDASQFDSIPTRAYDLKLLKVKIPSNYDPEVRSYSGEWDGTFVVDWTDNPAWCFYDLITNERYGLGDYIEEDYLDKWELYSIAQYCDELVPSGFKDSFNVPIYEPRFTCNVYLQTREEAYKVIRDMVSVFRGMVYWNANSIIPTQDKPGSVISQFNNSDVIDGVFTYEGSASRARHTVVLVAWNDPNYNYRKVLEYVEDQEGIAKYGINEMETVAFGCTSRGQAHRLGKWILYSELSETEMVSFKTSFEATNVYPGAIIRTHDQYRAGARLGGRIQSYTIGATSITIDSPIQIDSGVTYTLSLTTRDGSIIDKVLTNSPTTSANILEFDTPILEPLSDLGIWIVTSSQVSPEEWRVISITEDDKHEFTISALEYNGSKYGNVENGFELEQLPVTLSTNNIDIIDSGSVIIDETLYTIGFRTFSTKIHISWEEPEGASKYRLTYRRDEENYQIIDVTNPEVILTEQRPGTYTFKLTAYNALGASSTPITIKREILGVNVPPVDVTGFTYTNPSNNIELTWDIAVNDIDVFNYEIRRGGTDWETATYVTNVSDNNIYTLYDQIGNETYRIKAVDIAGNYSVNATNLLVPMVYPTVDTFTNTFNKENIILSWESTNGLLSIDKYELRKGGINWENSTFVGYVTGNTHTFPIDSVEQTYRLKAVDVSGNKSINDTILSYTITAPVITNFVHNISSNTIILDWDVESTIDIEYFELRYDGIDWDASALLKKVTASYYTNTVAYGQRIYRLKAVPYYGQTSVEHTITVDIVEPTMLPILHTFVDDKLRLELEATKGDLSIQGFEIRQGGTEWSTATLVTRTESDLYLEIVDWTSKTYRVKAYDFGGNYSIDSEDITIIIDPPSLANISFYHQSNSIYLDWDSYKGSLPVVHYKIREGNVDWDLSGDITTVLDTTFVYNITWLNNYIHVRAVDILGNESNTVTIYSQITPPSTPTLSYKIVGTKAVIEWEVDPGTCDVAGYVLKDGDETWETAVLISNLNNPTYTEEITWTTKTFRVKGIDVAGNLSTVDGTIQINIVAPMVSNLSFLHQGENIFLDWESTPGSVAIDRYEIREDETGNTWETATDLTTIYDTVYVHNIHWLNNYMHIRAVDILGNVSNVETIYSQIIPPSTPIVDYQFTDKEIVLVWEIIQGTCPIDHFVVRAGGTSWETAVNSVGTFEGNTYLEIADWDSQIFRVKAIDTAGNESTIASETLVIVEDPVISNITLSHTNDSAVIKWEGTRGSLGVLGYEIKTDGSDWNTASYQTIVEGTTYQQVVDWPETPKTFRIRAKDYSLTYSNELVIVSTIIPPDAPIILHNFVDDKSVIEFSSNTNTLAIKEYEIREGDAANWELASYIGRTTGSQYIEQVDLSWTTKKLWVRAIDFSGAYSAESTINITVQAPQPPVITTQYVGRSIVIDWTAASTSFPIAYYQVKADGLTWDTATTDLGTYDVTTLTLLVAWLGNRTFHIKAYDIIGFASNEGSAIVSPTLPVIPVFEQQVVDNTVLLKWSVSEGSLPCEEAEVRRGDDYDTAEIVGRKTGTFTSLFESTGGLYTYWITPIDTAGNYGTSVSQVALVNQPPDYILRQIWESDFSGDKVNMKVAGDTHWQNGFEDSEIDDWVVGTNATLVGSADYDTGIQAGLVTQSVSYTGGTSGQGIYYQIPEYIGTHRFAGHTIRVKVRAKQPTTNASSQFSVWYYTMEAGNSGAHNFTPTAAWADYEFTYTVPSTPTAVQDRLDIIGDTSATGKAVLIDSITISVDGYASTFNTTPGNLIGPINLSETFAEHFTSQGWDQPSDQTGAGYPYYIQPTLASGTYEEIFDYGTTLSASKITVIPTVSYITGDVVMTPNISVSLDGTTWVDYINVTEVSTNDFRYVKVLLEFDQISNDGIVEVSDLTVKLDSKIRSDAGRGTALDTDVDGTEVFFAWPFVDVAAISVTPLTINPVINVVNFQDVPNPASFKVLLFDNDGNRVSGDFSWTARGY